MKEINKESLEELLGTEIDTFSITPTFSKNGNVNILNVNIKPKSSVEFIETKISIHPTGTSFDDIESKVNKVYVIQNRQGGYWSNSYGKFKGYLFADEFDSLEDAEKESYNIKEPVFISPLYL